MKNSNVQLADLKESNMNQLIASEMFMIRGGGGKKGYGKSRKGSKKGSRKGSRKSGKGSGHKHNRYCGHGW